MNELASDTFKKTESGIGRSNGGAVQSKAVVIGSGIGGIAAAIRLLAKGYDVDLLEALDQPGGRARVFHQDGFVFDAGPTIITAPFLFSDLWSLFGRKIEDDIEILPLDPFYKIRLPDGHLFSYSGDRGKMRTEIAKISPGEEDKYDDLMRDSEAIYKVGFEQLCNEPIDTVLKMLSITPSLIRFRFHLSVYRNACRYFKHPYLRRIFSFHPLLIGGNPFDTTAIYSLIAFLEKEHGVHFPRGGMGALIKAMVKLFEEEGGRIHFNAPVKSIEMQGDTVSGVTLENGTHLPAETILSNADLSETYTRLLPEKAAKRWTPAKIEKSRHSMGLFVWYFGTKRQYPDIPHHMIMLNERYKELLEDIFQHTKLADDFSLYLHRPTASDPSLAPEGCDSFYVLSPVPNLDGDIDWITMEEVYRKKIETFLAQTVLPDLENQIASSYVMTPLNFQNELRSNKGSGFSLAPHLLQSAWFRPHNRSEKIKGLYLVGAGTHPGAGLPGVLSSARVATDMVPHAAS